MHYVILTFIFILSSINTKAFSCAYDEVSSPHKPKITVTGLNGYDVYADLNATYSGFGVITFPRGAPNGTYTFSYTPSTSPITSIGKITLIAAIGSSAYTTNIFTADVNDKGVQTIKFGNNITVSLTDRFIGSSQFDSSSYVLARTYDPFVLGCLLQASDDQDLGE